MVAPGTRLARRNFFHFHAVFFGKKLQNSRLAHPLGSGCQLSGYSEWEGILIKNTLMPMPSLVKTSNVQQIIDENLSNSRLHVS